MNHESETVREACRKASSFLSRHGVQDSGHAAKLLLMHVLQWDASSYYLKLNDPFPEHARAEWSRVLKRKADGEPVQYIIGEQEFFGLPFKVNRAVLIPRPETELLVEHILMRGMAVWPKHSTEPPAVADIGTGSGAIAVTLAVKRQDWRIWAGDISEEALAVARTNAALSGVEGRVTFVRGDLLQPFVEQSVKLDILVSNPPYIATRDIDGLQPEVKCYEPKLALDGGADGMDLYRRMMRQIGSLPEPPRLTGFEAGLGQAEPLAELMRLTGYWNDIAIIRDLAGIERHVIGSRL